MIADFPQQVEMKFWNVAIDAMTRNKTVQKIVRATYKIGTDSELRKRTLLILSGSVLGFLTGLIMFAFTL